MKKAHALQWWSYALDAVQVLAGLGLFLSAESNFATFFGGMFCGFGVNSLIFRYFFMKPTDKFLDWYKGTVYDCLDQVKTALRVADHWRELYGKTEEGSKVLGEKEE